MPTSLNTRSTVSSDDVTETALSQAATSAPENQTDMHIKKQRILGAVSDTNIPISQAESANTSVNSNVIVTASSSDHSRPLPPTTSTLSALRTDKRSDGSIDGNSSGYGSATTTENTVSPTRSKDGQRIGQFVPMSMNSLPRFNNPASSLSSPQSSVGNTSYPAAPKYAGTSLSTSSNKLKGTPDRSSDTSSPLVIDTSKESPLVPYRDPELLKRDAEVRKMAHTPAGSQQPHQNIPTTRSLPSAPTGVPTLPQASLPTAAAAAMLNPQMAQHINMQVMQQYQLFEQYRQFQAMQNLNPLQLSLLQHQAVQAAQQQLAIGSLYDRQSRAPGMPNAAAAAAAPWMMMPPFSDKPLVNDLQREQELRALDQKDR